jgi:type IV secretion system protein VirB5
MRRLLASTILAAGLGLGLGAGVGQPAHAAIPVIDLRAITQAVAQLEQMAEDFGVQMDLLTNAQDQLVKLQEQFDKLEEIRGVLTGERDILDFLMDERFAGLLDGDFVDVLDSIQAVQNGDWSQLAGANSGAMQEGIVKVLNDAGFDAELIANMAAGNPDGEGPSDPTGTPGDGVPTDRVAQNLATQATSGATMSAAAQVSHDNAGIAAERIETLVAAIPSQPDLKASIDHNTRVTAELGIVMLEMLRLQSVATVGAGQAGVIDAATIAAEREYVDFTLPDME